MQKQKKYDWKDTNMALFGSDTEKNVKKESAMEETAWRGAGEEVGLQIWRIVKFKVTDWPKEDYGKFYSGDSYIILNTYKEGDSDELLYDVHFWIGKYSTQDEYGTAAYKTVELDTFLDDKPVQHREVQGHESSKFKSYFGTMTIMKGGADTGFNRVTPEEYVPRLFHIEKTSRKNINVTEIPRKRGHMKEGDVYVLDMGMCICQINLGGPSPSEKFNAGAFISQMKGERKGNPEVKIENPRCVSELPETMLGYIKEGERKKKEAPPPREKVLLRVSDESGHAEYKEVKRGVITPDMFHSEDVYIFNHGDCCYVWVGSGASIEERRNGIPYASNYLARETDCPWLPITVLAEGKRCQEFDELFH